jgi:hypothetical protein
MKKVNLDEPKIIKETLRTWEYGKASAYFNPFSNEIHLLNGQDLEDRAETHERIHWMRQDKVTFQLASLIEYPAAVNLMFSLVIALAVFGAASISFMGGSLLNLTPMLFAAAVFTALLTCHAYEEHVADQAVAKSCRETKQNDDGEET